jgi:hypothetical protein
VQCSWLEWPSVRIHDILHGPPLGRARLADCLNEAIEQLGAELAARWEVEAELGALRTLATQVWDLLLDNDDGPSSLALSFSMAMELLEGRADATVANGVC